MLGQDFYIELQTSNGQQANDGNISWQRLLDFQNASGYATTSSLPGQSFYSSDGSNWTDLYSVDGTHSENFAIDGLTIASTPIVWALAASGNWSAAGSWKNGTVPNGLAIGAVINASTTAALTITLDQPVTIGTLLLGNSGGATVGYTLSGTGTNTLTLSNSGNGAVITVTDGTHVIDAPVVLADNLTLTGGGTLAFGSSSSITDNGGGFALTMNGPGTLILSGSDNYSGGTTVDAGTLILTSNTALPPGSNLTIGAGGTLIFDPSQVVAAPMSASRINPVPEPSTLALLAAGAIGLLGYAWRRRRS